MITILATKKMPKKETEVPAIPYYYLREGGRGALGVR
jgi:hypothetical protein